MELKCLYTSRSSQRTETGTTVRGSVQIMLVCYLYTADGLGSFPLSFLSAVPPLASTVSPSLALLANNLSMPPSDLPPGASPRKKPRKQQHVISTEEGDMMETNSTDDEKSTAKSLLVKAEKRKSPPKEYIGNVISNVFFHMQASLFSFPFVSPEKVLLLFSRILNTNDTESKYLFLSAVCVVMFRENDLSQHRALFCMS